MISLIIHFATVTRGCDRNFCFFFPFIMLLRNLSEVSHVRKLCSRKCPRALKLIKRSAFDEHRSRFRGKHTRKHAASARVIRCTFCNVDSPHLVGPASRWAMLDGMRNTSGANRHSYLNQHNSGDEWLTGFGGRGGRWGRETCNALHLWKLLRPNFSVKCMIYGRAYYLRSCPSTIQCTSHRSPLGRWPPRPENYFAFGRWRTKNPPPSVHWRCRVINAFLIVIRNTPKFMVH